MIKNIEVNDFTKPFIIKGIESAIDEKKRERDVLSAEIKQLEDLLSNLASPKVETSLQVDAVIPKRSSIVSEAYSTDWGLTRKIDYILSKKNRVLSSRQIADTLKEIDPDIESESGIDLSTRVASSIIKTAKKGVKYHRFKDEDGVFVYGFSEWFNDGIIKDEHKPVKK